MAGKRASANFSRKIGSPGRQRGGMSSVESGVFGSQGLTSLGTVVETLGPVHGGPHAYTCETKQEGTFPAGRL